MQFIKASQAKSAISGAILLGIGLCLTGCSKAPEEPPADIKSGASQIDSRIQSIQNDPKMSAAEKQAAIENLKSRQGGSAASTTSNAAP